jgi:hypothetical protein
VLASCGDRKLSLSCTRYSTDLLANQQLVGQLAIPALNASGWRWVHNLPDAGGLFSLDSVNSMA